MFGGRLFGGFEIEIGERPLGEQFGRGEPGIFVFRRGPGHRHRALGQFGERRVAHVGRMDRGRALAAEHPQRDVLAFGAPDILELAEPDLDFFGGGADRDRVGGIGPGLERQVDRGGAAGFGVFGVKHGDAP